MRKTNSCNFFEMKSRPGNGEQIACWLCPGKVLFPSKHIRRTYTALTAQALSIRVHFNRVYKGMISHSASDP